MMPFVEGLALDELAMNRHDKPFGEDELRGLLERVLAALGYGPGMNVDNYVNTSPVGSFAAGKNGIHDLGGNVWEWCEDGYNSGQTSRVLRGGSWYNNLRVNLRSACRNVGYPRYRNDNYGFRVVLVGGGG